MSSQVVHARAHAQQGRGPCPLLPQELSHNAEGLQETIKHNNSLKEVLRCDLWCSFATLHHTYPRPTLAGPVLLPQPLYAAPLKQ